MHFFHMLSFATMANTKVNMKRFLSLYSNPVVYLSNSRISNKGKSESPRIMCEYMLIAVRSIYVQTDYETRQMR